MNNCFKYGIHLKHNPGIQKKKSTDEFNISVIISLYVSLFDCNFKNECKNFFKSTILL